MTGGRDLPATHLGRYRLRALLGRGAMGEVYAAHDDELDRAVALKILRTELTGTRHDLEERLRRESRMMAAVVDPAMIVVHDVGRAGDIVYIAMELIAGCTLSEFLARHRLSWREIALLFTRAGAGLAAAHRAGIVHRDFKPDNVLIELADDRAQRVVITDFGIATAAVTAGDGAVPGQIAASARLTATGMAIGTPAYMAPEQLAGGAVDQRADVFAFCASLWEAWYGTRPFPGATVADIHAAMTRPLRPTHDAVPRRVRRAIERGLAIDPGARWSELQPVLAALAAAQSPRRTVAIAAAAAVVLVGAGVAGASLLARAPAGVESPCAHQAGAVAVAANPAIRAAIAGTAAREPVVRKKALAKIDKSEAAWRTTQAATCHADREPAQDPTVAACLDARALELDGFVDDVLAGDATASTIGQLAAAVGDPARCAQPTPGLLAAHAPAEPALRRKVTALRRRMLAVEAMRDRGELTAAETSATALIPEAAALWPMAHAESLYLLGTIQVQGGSSPRAAATLKRCAAVAEAAHADAIAANAWLQIGLAAVGDISATASSLEYLTYADAALDRLGRPPEVEALYQYVRGAVLADAKRPAEAEAAMRRAVELSESRIPRYLPAAIQGLGYLYEQQGRFTDAIAAYRQALAALPPTGASVVNNAVVFRERLATSLAAVGSNAEAEAVAREACARADASFAPDNSDRIIAHATLAQVLHNIGKLDAALAEARGAVAAFTRGQGEHGEQSGEALLIESEILTALGRDRDAADAIARACDVIAVHAGDDSLAQAGCWVTQAPALAAIGQPRAALALLERALPVLTRFDGDAHPQVARALVARGTLYAALGRHPLAVADFEHAVAMLATLVVDPGRRADAEWALAKELWRTDHARAKQLLVAAVGRFKGAAVTWTASRDAAAAWLATDGHPAPRPHTRKRKLG